MRRRVLTITILAASLVAIGLAQTSEGRQFTRSLGLSAPREGFTELYFTHPSTAGTASVRSGSRTLVSFVISNRENARTGYSWLIEPGAGGSAVRGTVSVDAGDRVAVANRVTVSCATSTLVRRRGHARRVSKTMPKHPTRVPVRVMLAGRPESITEWVGCYG